jgi:ATP-dependent exoDNAse (exonuclease V) alpha subunit
VQVIRNLEDRGLAHPVWDCQVICAVNESSKLSRKAINKLLQQELNPTGESSGDNPFRVGDKVVCLKNSMVPMVDGSPAGFNGEASDGKVFVANGEQGEVKHVEPNITIVQLDGPSRLVKVPRGRAAATDADDSRPSTGCQWDLAYAVSCHKAQGSEFPVVFVVLDEHYGAQSVCSREWLYTACSRAKTACFLVGKLGVAHEMIGREAIKHRKTFLSERIRSLGITHTVGIDSAVCGVD